MQRWIIVTTNVTTGQDAEGKPITLPAGTVLNEVLWDGVSDWTPPPGTRVQPLLDNAG